MECSLDLAVDLVNTFSPESGRDDLDDVRALNDFLKAHMPSYRGRPTKRDLEEVNALRARLREVFEAKDQQRTAELLNRLLAASGARPELTNHDGDPWHLHYTPMSAPIAPRIAAEAAMALSVVIAEDGFDRLRICDGPDCFDVFVDASKNRSRRFCSPQVCGNRASVAAYRARARASRG